MKIKIYILSVLIITFGIPGIRAQQVNVSARLQKDTILIGDQISYKLSFTGPIDAVVDWPFFQDTLTDKVEITERSKIDSIIYTDRDLLNLEQNITVTSFDSGFYQIPPVDFVYMMPDDTTDYHVITQPAYLAVNTVEVDTTAAIKPIKGPMDAPYTFREFLPWFFVIIGGLLIVFVLLWFRFWRKKEKKFTWIKPKPKLPPHVVAVNELVKLRHKKLWQAEKYKEYYTELTNIMRTYLDGRFYINAMEMTSFEIIEKVREAKLDKNLLDKLSEVLSSADMVKFAKEKPLPTENDKAQKYAEEFVKQTIPKYDNDGVKDDFEKNSNKRGTEKA